LFQLGHAQFLTQFFPDSGASLRFDPQICELVESKLPAEPDNTLDTAGCGVTDDLFLFAMSNTVTPSYRPDASTGPNDLCSCGSGIKFKRCHGARVASRKRLPEPQGYEGDFMTEEEFLASLPKRPE
jgi:hypothetical protein